MKLKAPAKLNLFLKLTGKRVDGYHTLESVFSFLDLYDFVEVVLGDKFELNINGEFAPNLHSQPNIIIKILDYFVTEFKIANNLKINLTKNIPVAAGLGGGSSDAAAFIKIINKLFSLNLSKKQLQEISIKFGSDIAFFFEDQSAIVRGQGQIITPYPQFEPIATILINPKISLSTKDVFNQFQEKFSLEISDNELRQKNIFALMNLQNDLTKPAISILPVIKEIIDELKNENAKIAKMSGSGATCFAIFAQDQIDEAYENLQKKFPDFYIKKTKILSHV